ncbi:MAG: hypothetical protein ACREJN_10545 [Nitrospiraceae bacterium]
MRSIPARTLSAMCVYIVTAGCGLPVLDLRDDADLHRASFHDKLTARGAFTQEFVACTKRPYDERGPTSRSIDSPGGLSSERPLTDEQLSNDGYLAPIHALIDRLRESRQAQADSLSVLEDLVGEWISEPRQRLDLGKVKSVVDVIQRWYVHFNFDEDELSRDSSRFARMLLAYNKAYFGDLSFIPRPDYAGAGLRGVIKVTSKGFVDRSGNALLFPGISAEIEVSPSNSVRILPTTVDSQRISADLTRIFLEAFFDAAFRVPAVHGATALRMEPNSQESPYPEFDANHPTIPLDALARVTRDALRAEAAVTSLVGKAVRGGSVFGTQNETLAASLETAAGMIAKKLVEHEGFCYFQVLAGQPAIATRDQNELSAK